MSISRFPFPEAISDNEPPTRFQDPPHLVQDFPMVRSVAEALDGPRHIEGAIGESGAGVIAELK
jgi:hypothetical protein